MRSACSGPAITDHYARQERSTHTAHHVDRRSLERPLFVEGWRKMIPPQTHCARSNGTERRVEVWVANISVLLEARSCLQVLTEHDWNWLIRFQDPTSRYSATAARILVRLALSRSLDHRIARSHWRFASNASGKPIVTNADAVNFSVSHVDELVAVAVSSGMNVGIDIENADQDVSDAVIEAFCHGDEQVSISALPSSHKKREFIRLWTYKEAYSKLVGLGHALDFKKIVFRSGPIELRQTDPDHAPGSSTRFESFWISVDKTLFHGALAFDQPIGCASSAEVQFINLVNRDKNGHPALVGAAC